jgi:LmbE family N-acetylglucosaminyl deacetylase
MQLSRLKEDGLIQSDTLEQVIPHTTDEPQRWLFIAPHDDDIAIGGGLLLQQAVQEGIQIKILITTDGSMGYCTLAEKDLIAEIRKRETRDSFNILGIEDVEWLDYPDANLMLHSGRREAGENPDEIAGYSGLQNSYTAHLRAFRPSHVFIMSENDYNPDHKIVYQEVLISVFHAQGAIWPELGAPLSQRPHMYELAAYCNFSENPNVEIIGTDRELEKKLSAVESFQSQKQIEMLIENLRANGPYEYLRDIGFDYYQASAYYSLFHGMARQ